MWTTEQIAAFRQLQEALNTATETGLFDSAQMWDVMHPSTINDFCDGVSELRTYVSDRAEQLEQQAQAQGGLSEEEQAEYQQLTAE